MYYPVFIQHFCVIITLHCILGKSLKIWEQNNAEIAFIGYFFIFDISSLF